MDAFFATIADPALFATVLRVMTPLLLAGLGVLISDRAGVLNIGMEGMMLVGALTGVLVSAYTGNAWLGFLAALILCGFVGWIIAARRRSHIRITVFADLLPKPAGRLLEIVTQAAIILFAAILIRYSFGLIERTWDVESIALPVSSAALYVVMPLAGLALILQALAEIGDVVAGRKVETAEPGTQPL